MARARALLFPGEEDFGIVPVEAMAHGCPVVAYGVGGACETVAAGVTGVLFGEQTVEALCEAMLAGERTTFDPAAMHAHAQQFGKVRFLREMGELLSHRGASGPKGMIT
jgi:glycosyltransferase involved in cell wall biosynthesis